MTDPEFVAGTLAWCNEIRAEKDVEPLDVLPKGQRRNPRSCPCGAATGLYVFSTGAESEAHGDIIPITEDVEKFVIAFDDGKLPQYDIEAA